MLGETGDEVQDIPTGHCAVGAGRAPRPRRVDDLSALSIPLQTVEDEGAVDSESGMIYVPSYATPRSVSLTPPDPNRSDLRYVPDGWYEYVEGPRGLPLVKPPYGRVTAIDLATGEHVWVAAHGEGPRNHPTIKHLGLDRLGSPDRAAAPLVTKTLLFVTHRAENTTGADSPIRDRPAEISVYDKKTGAYLGGIELPATPNSNLITYEVGVVSISR